MYNKSTSFDRILFLLDYFYFFKLLYSFNKNFIINENAYMYKNISSGFSSIC